MSLIAVFRNGTIPLSAMFRNGNHSWLPWIVIMMNGTHSLQPSLGWNIPMLATIRKKTHS
jgi:hypothetical protein